MADLKYIKIGTYKSSRQNVNTMMQTLQSLVNTNFLHNMNHNTRKVIGSFALLSALGVASLMGNYMANSVADKQGLKTERAVATMSNKLISQSNALAATLERINIRIQHEKEMKQTQLDQLAILAGQDRINDKEINRYHDITKMMISSAVDQYDNLVKNDAPIEVTEKFEMMLNTFNQYGYEVTITSVNDSYTMH